MRGSAKMPALFHLGFIGLVAAQTLDVSVRLLYQNNLTTGSEGALWVNSSSSYSLGESYCSKLYETPLSEVSSDIQAQLRYLVFENVIANNTKFWLASDNGGSSCTTYSLAKGTESCECDQSYAMLCTQSASAYSIHNSGPSYGSYININAGNLSVTGFRDARSFRFLGIPFAAPPTGDLRFRAPQPYEGSSSIDATKFGQQCIQAASDFSIPGSGSEDCLTLNIYTPYLPSQDSASYLRPVAFEIYGGGFVYGSNAVPAYDGGNMASRGDVVQVNINYRLGALGSLATSNKVFPGSQGILDQIQALRWVQQYISHFGGDPDKVTIFGESAGGQSVIALLSSSAASEYYAAAIQQSAPAAVPWASRKVYTEFINPALGQALNCSDTLDETALINCFLAVEDAGLFVSSAASTLVGTAAAQAFAQYDGASAITTTVEPYLPIVNAVEGVIEGQFATLIQDGKLPGAGKSVMMGNMKNEAVLFLAIAVPSGIPSNNGTLQIVLDQSLPAATKQTVNDNPTLFPFNTSDPDGVTVFAGNVATLFVWSCPLYDIVNSAFQQKTFSDLYVYRFDNGLLSSPNPPALCTIASPDGIDYACHSGDVIEVFGTTEAMGFSFNSTNPQEYSQIVIDSWISFFRTHNPQPNEAYLQARGVGYEATLFDVQNIGFPQYEGSGTKTVHQFAFLPGNIAQQDYAQCQAIGNQALLYKQINSTFVDSS